MFGKVGSKIQGFDEWSRAQAAERAYGARRQQMGGIMDDMRSQMGATSPDVNTVAGQIASLKGGEPGDYLKTLQAKGKRGDVGREALYQEAAAASGAGPLARLNSMLSGTDAMSRAGQVGVYGGIGVGGGLGLTAAGQGLVSLMEYLQQGQSVDAQRDQVLM